MKPKTFRKGNKKKVNNYDSCQTPFYALDPLIPYIKDKGIIWESAAGDGHIVSKLKGEGFDVVASDILANQNFFEYTPLSSWNCQVTNPPYSLKYEWLEHSYQLAKPFALLLPLETLGAAKGQVLFDRYEVEIILMNKRVNFKMPNIGYSGKGAQFPTAWFTFGLGIGQTLTYSKIQYYADEQIFLLTPKVV